MSASRPLRGELGERHTLMDRVVLELVEEIRSPRGLSPGWRSSSPRRNCGFSGGWSQRDLVRPT